MLKHPIFLEAIALTVSWKCQTHLVNYSVCSDKYIKMTVAKVENRICLVLSLVAETVIV